MQTTDWRNDVNRFDRALRELRRETPKAGLENARAQFIDRRVPNRLPRVLVFGLAAGVVAMAPFVLRTPAAATMTMAEVRAAAEAAPRMHSRWYQVKDGVDTKMYMEQWQDGTRFRHDIFDRTVGEVQHAYDGKRGWSRFAKKRYVSVTSKPQFERSFADSLQRMFESGEVIERRKLPTREVQMDGRRVLEVSLDSFMASNSKYALARRYVWLVEPEGKRPLTLRVYEPKGDGWRQVSRAIFDYPTAPLDVPHFQLAPRDGERLFDRDEEAQSLPGLWAKGLGSQKVGSQTIMLRDVVLDQNGIAGVIWTGGGRFEKAQNVTITDRAGKKWTGRPYLAYTRSPLNRIPEARLTKIEGLPNRMVLMYGLHGVVAAPFRVEIPVAAPNGKPAGTATFQVSKFRETDQLYDLADQMGIAEKNKTPTRAIKR